MTIIVPVAIPAAGLPLPDPTDRATFSARKLEQIRWANNEYATYSYNLGVSAYSNAQDAQTSATTAAAQNAAAANSAALSAGYAGATLWISGTTYALGLKVWSPSNGRVYRKITATAGGSVDPASNTTDWAVDSLAVPVQLVSGLVQQMIAGGAYAATNTTAQAAATNICLWSEDFTQWTKTGTGSISADSAMDPNGGMTMDKLTDSDVGSDACHFSRTQTVPNDSLPYVTSVYLRQDTAAATLVNAYFLGGTTVTAGVIVTWGATPSIAAVGAATSPVLTYIGNGIYRASFVSNNNSTGNTSHQVRVYPAGSNAAVTGSVYAWGANAVQASAVSSYIASGAAAGVRAAGLVEPTRFIGPASPSANDWLRIVPRNGITTNVFDPNGSTVEGNAGPLQLDDGPVTLQYINSTWSIVK